MVSEQHNKCNQALIVPRQGPHLPLQALMAETLDDTLALERLVEELLSSPAVCNLIKSIHDAVEQQDPALPGGGGQHDSPIPIPADVLQLTLETLLEECQQKTCTSSDTTLAMKGLSDQTAVHLQVHRCVLT